MSKILERDFGIAPLFLMRGRPDGEQILLLYLWNYALTGKKWAVTSAGRECGMGAARVKSALAALVGDGLVMVENDIPHALAPGLVPETRPAAPPQPAKKAVKFPAWVFKAINIWREHLGEVGPKATYTALKPVVEHYGEENTLEGLRHYARVTPPRYAPSLFKFTRTAAKWVRPAPAPVSASFADMCENGKDEARL